MICAKAVARICEASCEFKILEIYEQLPPDIQKLADRSFELLKRDARHPSLHFKKVGRFWSGAPRDSLPRRFRRVGRKIWFGSGLAAMMNTMRSSADDTETL
jgi:hypothetical protein